MGKIKLKLTTLPRIFLHVVFHFKAVVFTRNAALSDSSFGFRGNNLMIKKTRKCLRIRKRAYFSPKGERTSDYWLSEYAPWKKIKVCLWRGGGLFSHGSDVLLRFWINKAARFRTYPALLSFAFCKVVPMYTLGHRVVYRIISFSFVLHTIILMCS